MNVKARKHIAWTLYIVCYCARSLARVYAFLVDSFVHNKKAYTCGIGTRYFGAHRHGLRSFGWADCVLVHVLSIRGDTHDL